MKSIELFTKGGTQRKCQKTCKPCKAQKSKEYRKAYPERDKASKAASNEKNYLRVLIEQTRCSAKARDLEHKLELKDLAQKWDDQEGRCYWFNVPMTKIANEMTKVSVDRLDITKGYTVENTVLTCMSANFARNRFSVDEWQRFLQLLKDNLCQP